MNEERLALENLAARIKEQMGIAFRVNDENIQFQNHIAVWKISMVHRLDGKTSYIVVMKPGNQRKHTGYGQILDSWRELKHCLATDELLAKTNSKKG